MKRMGEAMDGTDPTRVSWGLFRESRQSTHTGRVRQIACKVLRQIICKMTIQSICGLSPSLRRSLRGGLRVGLFTSAPPYELSQYPAATSASTSYSWSQAFQCIADAVSRGEASPSVPRYSS